MSLRRLLRWWMLPEQTALTEGADATPPRITAPDRRVVFLGAGLTGRYSLMRVLAKRAERSATWGDYRRYDDGFGDLRRVVDLHRVGRSVTAECVSHTIVSHEKYISRYAPGASLAVMLPMRDRYADAERAWVSERDTRETREIVRCLAALGVDAFDDAGLWVYAQCDRPSHECLVRDLPWERLRFLRTSAVTGEGVDALFEWVMEGTMPPRTAPRPMAQ